jgi:aryl-phospho-beta-D-glucosidase BglC (GH1 family)
MFDKVAEDKNEPQGVIFPPMLPNGFGEMWYSEGDLINKLFTKFGGEKTIEILTAHRSEYVTKNDFMEMKQRGISQVRLPVGWWAFAEESKYEFPIIITDPLHSDRKFVTIPNAMLVDVIRDIQEAGLTCLIDIHAFPGGSAGMY